MDSRRSTSVRDLPVTSEELGGDLQGSSDNSQPIGETTDHGEARDNVRSVEGNYIYRHRGEPPVQLYVPKEETFPIPPIYIDVFQVYTHTDLDVLQESQVDDYWSIGANRNLSEPCTGFTQLTNIQ